MKIPNLKAEPGDEVFVENYRLKNKEWERGILMDAEYRYCSYRKAWSYRVKLSRMSKSGNHIILTVGQGKIKKAT